MACAFVRFVLVLLGIALVHPHSLGIAHPGVAATTACAWVFTSGFDLGYHPVHEGEHTLLARGGLRLGFAILAAYVEPSGVPAHVPRLLLKDPLGGGFGLHPGHGHVRVPRPHRGGHARGV